MRYKPLYKWICLFPTKNCYQSTINDKCCCECEKLKSCKYACLNTPEKCGAIKNKYFKEVN